MRRVLVLFLAALLSSVGYSAVIYVPDDFSTIQEAINAARDGDTVIVRPGTYVENIDFLGKAIAVTSEVGPEVTTIDGDQAGSVVTFSPDSDVPPTIEGFMLTNGLASRGGGISCQSSNPSIDNCIIENNGTFDGADGSGGSPGEPGGNGGGIFADPFSSIVVSGSTITGNWTGDGGESRWKRAYEGGDGGSGGGIFCSAATITDSIISGNRTGNGGYGGHYGGQGGRGGGLFCSEAVLIRCTVSGNTTGKGGWGYEEAGDGGHGGGIFCEGDSLTVMDCLIQSNAAGSGGNSRERTWEPGVGGNGGGICCISLYCRTSIITENRAGNGGGGAVSDGASGGFGGGIYCSDADLVDCTVSYNRSGNGGGGDYIDEGGGHGGGVFCSDMSSISSCTFSGNETGNGRYANLIAGDGGDGGGAYLAGTGPHVISSCHFIDNSTGVGGGDDVSVYGGDGGDGGGVHCIGSSTTILSSFFSGNETGRGSCSGYGQPGRGGHGGGVQGSDAVLSCCRFYSNRTGNGPECQMDEGGLGGDGAGLHVRSSHVVNCVVAANVTGDGGSSSWAAGGDGGNGAGMDVDSSTIINCTFHGNRCGEGGSGSPAGNTGVGGGIRTSSDQVCNSIFWNNSPEQINGSGTVVSYSDVEGGWPGTGNIDADPLFIDPAKDDCHIPFDSPCRSAGDRNAQNLPDTDFEGDPRTGLFAFPDMGADEFHTHFYVNGTVSNGGSATGVIIGWPNTNPVMLISGSGVLPHPDPTPFGDFWLMPPWEHRVHLHSMSDEGVHIIERVISTGLPPGTQVPLQALVGTELSNLCVVTVE